MKTCRACGAHKSISEFYQHKNGAVFLDCKICQRAKVRANRVARIEQYTAYDRSRANLPHRVEARARYSKTPAGIHNSRKGTAAWIERNPVKRAAHIACGNAVRDGRLTRLPCEVCGEARTQGHHDDYGKPLDVRWLCTTHHASWHTHNTPACPSNSFLI